MKKYDVKVTPYAESQMVEIRDYIAEQLLNPDAARTIIIEIRKAVNSLSVMPERIRTVDEEPWGSQGVRKISVNNYYVYYWIDEINSAVHVTAVAYSGRNQSIVLEETR